MLENRFELILRGLIRAGSSHTMSPAAKIKTRSGQIYAMPTFGQVGQSENRCGSGQLMNKRKKADKKGNKIKWTNKKQHLAKWVDYRTGANLVNPMATGLKSELTNLSNTFSQQFAVFILETLSLVVILLKRCIIAYTSQQNWKARVY